jgi:hypothetical protein
VGCALVSAGALRGSAASSTGARDATPFGGAGLRAAFDLPVGGGVTLRPFLEAEAAFTRTSLVYGGQDAWRTPPVFGSCGLAARVGIF